MTEGSGGDPATGVVATEGNTGAMESLALQALAGTPDLVAVLAGDDWRFEYVNAAAARLARVAGDAILGRPLADVFPRILASPLHDLLVATAATRRPQAVQSARSTSGLTWNLRVVPLDRDRVLIVGRPLDDSEAMRTRLEVLLESTEAIWAATDLQPMAQVVVDQAARIFAGGGVSILVLEAAEPETLSVIAASEPWIPVGVRVPLGSGPEGGALVERTPLEVGVDACESVPPATLRAQGIQAVRLIPLLAPEALPNGRPGLGVLLFMARGGAGFDDDERRLMDEFARRASLAVHRADLVTRERAAAGRLQVAFDAAMALGSSLSPREVVNELLAGVAHSLQADRATLSSLGRDELRIEASYDRAGAQMTWVGRSYPLSYLDRQPLVKRAVETGLPVIGGRLEVGSAAPEFQEALANTQHTVQIPLVQGGQVVALLVLSRISGGPFTDEDLALLDLIGGAAMLALGNARLHEQTLAAHVETARLVEELQTASHAKSEFLNLAAHELRTPISVLRGYLSMFIEGSFGDPPPNWEEPLRLLHTKSTELNDMVEALLQAARVQAGAMPTQVRRLDIAAEVSRACDRALPAVALAGGRLSMDLAAGVGVTADFDPAHLGRIVDNLLSNAVNYAGGPPDIRVRVTTEPAWVVVEVMDHGRGIPADAHERIFEQFTRIDDINDRFPAGTGLGLYIARGLARRHGGDLRVVRSRPGEGTVFALTIPLPDQP